MVNVSSPEHIDGKRRYDNLEKLRIVRKVVEHSHAEFKKDTDNDSNLIDSEHLKLNLLLGEAYKARYDKIANILQQILETKNILSEYLDDPQKRKHLAESSLENLEYLRKWCQTEFKKESDFKAYQAIVKDTLSELYSHEGYVLNYTSRSAYSAEIRKKFEELATKLTDSSYVYMVYSSSQEFFLKRREGTLTLSELDNKCMSSSSMENFEVDVKTSVSIKAKPAEICASPPPPPPPPPSFFPQLTLHSKTGIKITGERVSATSSTRASLGLNVEQVNQQLKILKEKRMERAREENLTELELLARDEQKREDAGKKMPEKSEYLQAICDEAKRKEMIRSFRKNMFKPLLEATSAMRTQLDKEAVSRSKKFQKSDLDENNKKIDQLSSSEIEPYAKFFKMQRTLATGKDDEFSGSDDEWSDHTENSSSVAEDALSPQCISEEKSQDELDIDQKISKLKL